MSTSKRKGPHRVTSNLKRSGRAAVELDDREAMQAHVAERLGKIAALSEEGRLRSIALIWLTASKDGTGGVVSREQVGAASGQQLIAAGLIEMAFDLMPSNDPKAFADLCARVIADSLAGQPLGGVTH